MPDITLVWNSAVSHADWVQNGALLATGEDLMSAIIISIFTDRMAAPGDVLLEGLNDPRGWWADGGVLIGSRMWLLRRAKQTLTTLQLAYDYLAESLQWLIDDGVVGRFDIKTQWVRTGVLGAQITAYSPTGMQLATGRFTWAWNGTS